MDESAGSQTFDERVRVLRRRLRLAIALVAAAACVGVVSQRPSKGAPRPTPVCQNSYDERCGPFRWEPQPDNQPLTVKLTTSTATARVGAPVTFHVVADDPDHHIDDWCTSEDYGDTGSGCEPECDFGPDPHGPWSPPPKDPGHFETDLVHTYTAPGTYTVHITYQSGICDPPTNPYGSQGSGSVTIAVAA